MKFELAALLSAATLSITVTSAQAQPAPVETKNSTAVAAHPTVAATQPATVATTQPATLAAAPPKARQSSVPSRKTDPIRALDPGATTDGAVPVKPLTPKGNARLAVPITETEPALKAPPPSSEPQTVTGALDLRSDVREVAEITGVLPILERLIDEQSKVRSLQPHSLEMVEQKQRILYLRQKVIQALDTALFEINCTDGKIERASANLADAEADLNEHRARTIRRNTMINFVSGGVTKMVGYSLALGSVAELTTNLLEVFDGGIQSTLSGLTIRDQKVENQMLRGVPGFMTTLVAHPVNTTNDYPPIVWQYLNNVPPGGKTTMTRRELLIRNWKQHGIMKSQLANMKAGPNGQIIMNSALEGKWIADHSAMMTDLKSVISQMNTGLMVLSELVKDSYNVDPIF